MATSEFNGSGHHDAAGPYRQQSGVGAGHRLQLLTGL